MPCFSIQIINISFVLQASPAAGAVAAAAGKLYLTTRRHLWLQDSAQGLILVVDLPDVIDLSILGELPTLEGLLSSNRSGLGNTPLLLYTAKNQKINTK
jgi:hypothetical protein